MVSSNYNAWTSFMWYPYNIVIFTVLLNSSNIICTVMRKGKWEGLICMYLRTQIVLGECKKGMFIILCHDMFIIYKG